MSSLLLPLFHHQLLDLKHSWLCSLKCTTKLLGSDLVILYLCILHRVLPPPPLVLTTGLSISDIEIFIAVQIRTPSHFRLNKDYVRNGSENGWTEWLELGLTGAPFRQKPTKEHYCKRSLACSKHTQLANLCPFAHSQYLCCCQAAATFAYTGQLFNIAACSSWSITFCRF